MELKAHFSNIHRVIIHHLEKAQTEIVAAIAWFTDRDIFEVLCKSSRSGIRVSVALIGDEINKGPGGLNFQRLSNFGGQVIFLPPGSRDSPTMHHKFCVIDGTTVITGSYNWSQKARSNDENITIVTDAKEFARSYISTFESLISRGGHGVPIVADEKLARRRLEMIRNLVLLGEYNDVTTHVRKLRPVAEILRVSAIITALDNGEYTTALEEIDVYLRRETAVLATGFSDIFRLRFLLATLELRIESLSDEKVELERRLITFNRIHYDVLGDLIKRVLKAKAELARLLAVTQGTNDRQEEGEAVANNAEETYQDYAKQYEAVKAAKPLPKLSEETERELKSLYRKACGLCHPDKVPEARKAAAHRVFVELQEAYKSNNLARVREIYEALSSGDFPGTRSTTLSEVEALEAAIAEMEYTIGMLVVELKTLQRSDGVRLVEAAGVSETDWQGFLERQRQTLEAELTKLESSILAARLG